ncbi:MAG: DUF4037 domain-containing protein [Clostridia bacterium]|nr:DUF4037 domain-containing protein [Clostridia bacterium]
MKGLELCRRFYAEYGEELLAQFPEIAPHAAVGLCGAGSECLGFDDDISRDHDFEPGFCIFLPGEDLVGRRQEFLLARAYDKLPREFLGCARSRISPVGGNRHGVLRLADFLRAHTGSPDGRLSLTDWLRLPEQSLLEVTCGALWRDDGGEFSRIRASLSRMPEDVRRKKLAGELLLMGQAGQYNYPRCLRRGDAGAAGLCAAEFVRSALHAAHLLAGRYMPYYKWAFRSLDDLPEFSDLRQPLERLLSVGGVQEAERVTALILAALRAQGLSDSPSEEAEAHAYAVNNTVRASELRNLHILAGV